MYLLKLLLFLLFYYSTVPVIMMLCISAGTAIQTLVYNTPDGYTNNINGNVRCQTVSQTDKKKTKKRIYLRRIHSRLYRNVHSRNSNSSSNKIRNRFSLTSTLTQMQTYKNCRYEQLQYTETSHSIFASSLLNRTHAFECDEFHEKGTKHNIVTTGTL